MSMARKIGSIILCFIAAIPLFVSPAFLIGRIIIRKSMLSTIEESRVLTLHIPKDELKWYTEGHELMVNGKMFDVKSIISGGDHFVVNGLFDDDETALNQMIATAQGRSGRDSSLILFKPCLGILAIIPVAPPGIGSIATIFNRYNFPLFVCSVADGFLRELIHPPDFLFIS